MSYRRPSNRELNAADRIEDFDDGGYEVRRVNLEEQEAREKHLETVFKSSQKFADWLDERAQDLDFADGDDLVSFAPPRLSGFGGRYLEIC